MKKLFFILFMSVAYFNSSCGPGDTDDFEMMTITPSTEGDFSSPRRTGPRRTLERRNRVSMRETNLTMVTDPIPERRAGHRCCPPCWSDEDTRYGRETYDRCCYLCFGNEYAQYYWRKATISITSAMAGAAITTLVFCIVLLAKYL